MSFTKRIKNAYKAFTDKQDKDTAMRALLDFLGLKDTKDSALSEATYFACLKVLSEALGKLPLKLLKHTSKNGVETARGHPLYSVLHDRPNPYMTATSFWATMEQNRNHYGNAYAWIKRSRRKN